MTGKTKYGRGGGRKRRNAKRFLVVRKRVRKRA